MDEERPLSFPVIIGTVRKARVSERVARLVVERLEKRPDTVTTLVDIGSLGIPVDDAGETAKSGEFSAVIDRADGLVLVVPEYNHGYPGMLKHVLDTNYHEYVHKPAGIVGVSAGHLGGARVVENLLPVLRGLGMVPLRTDVNVSNAGEAFDEDGDPADHGYVRRIDRFLAELAWMATTLRHGREHVPLT